VPVFGVYIHFPYCRKRCPFCDFAVAVKPIIAHDAYELAVLAELGARAPLYEGRALTSIYFGGGTPGLWRADCVGRVIAAVQARFGAAREITLECIPGELDAAHAAALREAGVTRLSIGIEALDDTDLARLGREHTRAQAEGAVAIARAAGFAQLSGDLMFALPEQTLAGLGAQIDALLALDLPHISAYQLTIEPDTAFGRLGVRPPEGEPYFLQVHDRLGSAGYEHYEISSYARPGARAVHNQLYWRGGEYLGLGMSAHSFRRLAGGTAERFANGRDLPAYLSDPRAPWALHEVLHVDTLQREALWLGLRCLSDGISRADFQSLHGADPEHLFGRVLADLRACGLVEDTPLGFRLTRAGMLLADEVALRFI
jgi:oxygen-independent coproporphyrinogen-3 oxidase